MRQAWIIVRATDDVAIPGNLRPSRLHLTLEDAVTEAERLARREGCEFWVFALSGIVRPGEPPCEWEWVDGPLQERLPVPAGDVMP